jgi:2'-5' RNA ligase
VNDVAPDERARLFVALELPVGVREALASWGAALDVLDALRLVGVDALHVTLCFLGMRRVGEIRAIGDACAAAVRGLGAVSVPLSLGNAVWLPPRRPHVLAVGVEDPQAGLGRVQSALSDALERGGWLVPEARPFLPHTTVGRVRPGSRLRAVELPPPVAEPFVGSTVTLFRSRTGPVGARYEALRSVQLQVGTG